MTQLDPTPNLGSKGTHASRSFDARTSESKRGHQQIFDARTCHGFKTQIAKLLSEGLIGLIFVLRRLAANRIDGWLVWIYRRVLARTFDQIPNHAVPRFTVWHW